MGRPTLGRTDGKELMPIPTPHDGEEQQAFVSRCMGDQVMQEYLAICYSTWRQHHKDADLLEQVMTL